MISKGKRNEDYINPDRSFGSGNGCLSLASEIDKKTTTNYRKLYRYQCFLGLLTVQ